MELRYGWIVFISRVKIEILDRSFFFIEKICCCFKSVYRGGNYLLSVLSSARKKLLLSVQGQSYSPSSRLYLHLASSSAKLNCLQNKLQWDNIFMQY